MSAATTSETLTITFSPPMASSSRERTSIFTQFLYSSAPFDTSSSTSINPSETASSSPSSSATVPSNAFWAVLSILILLLVLLAFGFPLWYCLRKRHKRALSAKHPGTNQPPLSPRAWLLSSLTAPYQNQQQQQQYPPPLTTQQQLQLLQQLSQSPLCNTPSPHNRSPSDPTTSAVLARIAALNNPSILGAIPEDSTQFTASSLHPRPPPVNQNYQRMMDRKMEELRLNTEAETKGGGGGAI
ncbi:MAG: hypothetical protein LQ352_003702, partial [Teloschistes flavicans]